MKKNKKTARVLTILGLVLLILLSSLQLVSAPQSQPEESSFKSRQQPIVSQNREGNKHLQRSAQN